MKLITKVARGTRDILPNDTHKWRFVEGVLFDEANNYGFKEIKTPVFEHTELFQRSVGDDTDVVQKEMYTFEDKSGRSITLRPEGTAGTVRAMLESGMYNDGLPVKLCYMDSCYRYEKPQSGRYREFFQFGSELFGSAEPTADVELICLVNSMLERLGLSKVAFEINSIGCKECRKNYYKALKEYFNNNKEGLCDTCLERLERNPMRILDCKNDACKNIAKSAPVVLDFLCDDCKEHFAKVKSLLDDLEINYVVNPSIVRGLDYYTRTVFELVVQDGEQKGLVIGGGGRYDGLIEEISGMSMPALGVGIGMDRLILAMESEKIEFPNAKSCDVYIASIGEKAVPLALKLAQELRSASFYTQTDLLARGLKAQMKYASKINASFTLILGDSEVESKKAMLKNMETGEQKEIDLDNEFLMNFAKISIEAQEPGLFSGMLNQR